MLLPPGRGKAAGVSAGRRLIAGSGSMGRSVLLLAARRSRWCRGPSSSAGAAFHRARSHWTPASTSPAGARVLRGERGLSAAEADPLVGVFQAGYVEVNQQVRGGTAPAAEPGVPCAASSRSRARWRAAGVEGDAARARLSFLATTASVTPFVGLGTVRASWTRSATSDASAQANLAVVAPASPRP